MPLAEVEHRHAVRQDVPEQRARRLRDQDLAAGARRGDARGADDVDPEVALVADVRLTGVEPHADTHLAPVRPGVLAQRALRRDRRRDRVARPWEREEERVALRVDLAAAGGAERLADDPAVVARQRPNASSPSSCRSFVDPSMSVNANVTVPAWSRSWRNRTRLAADPNVPLERGALSRLQPGEPSRRAVLPGVRDRARARGGRRRRSGGSSRSSSSTSSAPPRRPRCSIPRTFARCSRRTTSLSGARSSRSAVSSRSSSATRSWACSERRSPTATTPSARCVPRSSSATRSAPCPASNLQIRIAVNTGEAVVSLNARPALGESMVAGDVVNTASRLQSQAPVNGIVVGEMTYLGTRDVIGYEVTEAIVAKGKAAPVKAWLATQRVDARGQRATRDLRIVGRVPELQAARRDLGSRARRTAPASRLDLRRGGRRQVDGRLELRRDRTRARCPCRRRPLAAVSREQCLRPALATRDGHLRDLRERLAGRGDRQAARAGRGCSSTARRRRRRRWPSISE